MLPKMEPKWSHSETISSNILVPGATLGTNRLQVTSQTSLFMILEPPGPIFHDFRSCFVCFSDMFVFHIFNICFIIPSRNAGSENKIGLDFHTQVPNPQPKVAAVCLPGYNFEWFSDVFCRMLRRCLWRNALNMRSRIHKKQITNDTKSWSEHMYFFWMDFRWQSDPKCPPFNNPLVSFWQPSWAQTGSESIPELICSWFWKLLELMLVNSCASFANF
jgi:hypothetical protein